MTMSDDRGRSQLAVPGDEGGSGSALSVRQVAHFLDERLLQGQF